MIMIRLTILLRIVCQIMMMITIMFSNDDDDENRVQ
jgi:hypothetical protein